MTAATRVQPQPTPASDSVLAANANVIDKSWHDVGGEEEGFSLIAVTETGEPYRYGLGELHEERRFDLRAGEVCGRGLHWTRTPEEAMSLYWEHFAIDPDVVRASELSAMQPSHQGQGGFDVKAKANAAIAVSGEEWTDFVSSNTSDVAASRAGAFGPARIEDDDKREQKHVSSVCVPVSGEGDAEWSSLMQIQHILLDDPAIAEVREPTEQLSTKDIGDEKSVEGKDEKDSEDLDTDELQDTEVILDHARSVLRQRSSGNVVRQSASRVVQEDLSKDKSRKASSSLVSQPSQPAAARFAVPVRTKSRSGSDDDTASAQPQEEEEDPTGSWTTSFW